MSAHELLAECGALIFGTPITFRLERDNKRPEDGRFFLQCVYSAPCSVSGEAKEWHGRKWYLSDHMSGDEVVKTAYAAFKACVEHEVMEGFTFCGDRVFNPHTPFRVLLQASKTEEFRPERRAE